MPTTWFRYSLVYFLFTAAAGVVLRGMAFLPSWQVKYEPLLHAHSHLALLGWGYTALVLLLATRFLTPEDGRSRFLRINWLLTQLTIAGMFIAFLFQGYGLFSIMVLHHSHLAVLCPCRLDVAEAREETGKALIRALCQGRSGVYGLVFAGALDLGRSERAPAQ